jgi:hypothetical protein
VIARSARRRTATGFSGTNTGRCVHKQDQTERSDCRRRNLLAARNAHFLPRIFGYGGLLPAKSPPQPLASRNGRAGLIACPAARNEHFAEPLTRKKVPQCGGRPAKVPWHALSRVAFVPKFRSAAIGHRVFGFTVILPAGVVEAGRAWRRRNQCWWRGSCALRTNLRRARAKPRRRMPRRLAHRAPHQPTLEAIDTVTKALRKYPLIPVEMLNRGAEPLDPKTEIQDRSRRYCAERLGLTAPH